MNEIFASRLKMLREERGLSQSELADKISVSRGSISFYENKSRVPDIEVLATLCNYFSVSSDYLLGLSNVRNKTHADLFASLMEETADQKNSRAKTSIEKLILTLSNLCNLFNRLDIELLPYAFDSLNSIAQGLENLTTEYDKYTHIFLINRTAEQLLVDFNTMYDGETKKYLLSYDDFPVLLEECSKLNAMVKSFTPTEFAGDAIRAADNAQNIVANFALHLYAALDSLKQSESENPEK